MNARPLRLICILSNVKCHRIFCVPSKFKTLKCTAAFLQGSTYSMYETKRMICIAALYTPYLPNSAYKSKSLSGILNENTHHWENNNWGTSPAQFLRHYIQQQLLEKFRASKPPPPKNWMVKIDWRTGLVVMPWGIVGKSLKKAMENCTVVMTRGPHSHKHNQ